MKQIQNKKKLNRLSVFIGILFVALIGVFFLFKSYGASGEIILSSPVKELKKDQIIEVTVGINSAQEPVSIGHAYIIYDPSKLSYVSSDYNESSFKSDSPDAGLGKGYVLMSRYSTSPVSDNIIIGKIKFKVIATSGVVSVATDKSKSKIFSAKDASNILTSTQNFSANIATPTTDPGPKPKPEPKPTTKPIVDKKDYEVGTKVTVKTPDTTSEGDKVASTDVFLEDDYVGTTENKKNENEIAIDTENLQQGQYEVKVKSKTDGGDVEESSQSINLVAKSFTTKFKLPIALSGLSIAGLGGFFVIRFIYTKVAPFYKTIG
jgi:hypothetical protein